MNTVSSARDTVIVDSYLKALKVLKRKVLLCFAALIVPAIYAIGSDYHYIMALEAGFHGEILEHSFDKTVRDGAIIFAEYIPDLINILITVVTICSALVLIYCGGRRTFRYHGLRVTRKIDMCYRGLLINKFGISTNKKSLIKNKNMDKKGWMSFFYASQTYIIFSIMVIFYAYILSFGNRAAVDVIDKSGLFLDKCLEGEGNNRVDRNIKCVFFVDEDNFGRRGVYITGDKNTVIMRTGVDKFELFRVDQIETGFLFDRYKSHQVTPRLENVDNGDTRK